MAEVQTISDPSPKPTAPTPAPFRFSLLTLLSITTLAGFTSAVVFSKGWDSLERLLMAFWCAGLIVGVSFGRARGKPGILGGGIGAALGCALATTLVHAENYAHVGYALILMFVIAVGWLLAVCVTVIYHALLSGSVETWWQKRFVRRFAFALGGLLIASLIVGQAWRIPVWKPVLEQQIKFYLDANISPDLAISPEGDRFIVYVRSNQSDLSEGEIPGYEIHEITPNGLHSRSSSLKWGWDAHFAPNGIEVSAIRWNDCKLVDSSDGLFIWQELLKLNALEAVLEHRFSANGRTLYVTTHTPRIQRLHTVDIDGNMSAARPAELFPFAGHLYVSDGGNKLVKFFDATDENNEHSVEVMDLASRETICRLDDIAQIEKPVFSLAGDRLALGNRVWTIPDGSSQLTSGRVLGLLTKGRMLVVDRGASDHWRDYLPAWLQPMPFVRHLLTGEHLSQLRINDETGQTLLATPWLDNVHQVELSANQRVAISTSRAGQIRVWKVPE